MNLRIANGKLIIGSEIVQKDILVRDGKIEAIVDRNAETSDDYVTVDCAGNYVSAGFVDIHQHGGGGSDYMDDGADTFYKATESHLMHGTTSVMPTLLSASKEMTLRAIDNYKAAKCDKRIRANMLGLHLEGRYISPAQAGAQKPENIKEFDRSEYAEIIERGEGNIKRWSVAPELRGAKDFASYAQERGITLSIAHSDADFDTVLAAYKWGFRHVTHLYSCTSSIVRKEGFRVAGVLEAAYFLDGMNVEIIADGCHLPVSLLRYVAKFKDVSRISLITDAMRAAGEQTNISFLGSADDPLPVIVEDGVAKLTDRSAFAGSVATADRLLRTMRGAGVPLVDAVRMITLNPIESMGLEVKKGKLCEGYDADICVFDEDINIKHVVCGGAFVK